MTYVNIGVAKAKLSEYLKLAQSGERVIICERNRPIVELKGIPRNVLTDSGLAVVARPTTISEGGEEISNSSEVQETETSIVKETLIAA